MTKLTALEILADRSSTALKAAYRTRDAQAERMPINMVSYREGEAIAYTDAHRIMKAEIERLRNLFQNGALSMDDFRTF